MLSSRSLRDETWLLLSSDLLVFCKWSMRNHRDQTINTKEGNIKNTSKKIIFIEKLGCGMPGSNWRPPDYETDALTNWANPATRIRVDGRFPACSMLRREIVSYIASHEYAYWNMRNWDETSLRWGDWTRRYVDVMTANYLLAPNRTNQDWKSSPKFHWTTSIRNPLYIKIYIEHWHHQ